jgi:hypothetical protein
MFAFGDIDLYLYFGLPEFLLTRRNTLARNIQR